MLAASKKLSVPTAPVGYDPHHGGQTHSAIVGLGKSKCFLYTYDNNMHVLLSVTGSVNLKQVLCTYECICVSNFLCQMHADHKLASAWFLEITFVRKSLGVCICVCLP